jgi:AI-2 transport protein TqsA
MDTDQERADRRVGMVCLVILAVIALGVVLALLRPVLVPFCLALLLTYCLKPVIEFQVHSLRIPRGPALVGVGVMGLLILLFLGYLTAVAIGQIADHIEDYSEQLRKLVDRALAALPLERLGIQAPEVLDRPLSITEGAGRQILGAFLAAMTDLFSTGALVMIFMIFLLLGHPDKPYDPTSLLGEIEGRVRRYLLRLVGLSALTGLLVGLALAVLGVPFSLLFGFLTFLLNFIPNVGAIIAALMPVPVILLSSHLSPAEQALAAILPGAIQFVIGSFIQPRIYGGALDLHPVTVLLSLIFFGTIWGIIGAFLAMPITGVIRIVLGRIPVTRPLAAVMAGDLDVLTQPAEAARAAVPEPHDAGKG